MRADPAEYKLVSPANLRLVLSLMAAEPDDRQDLGGRLGQGDDVGGALVEGVHVALVDESPFLGGDEAVRAEDPLELVEEAGT